ncbi:hypothetical protein J4730_11355 [Klebsiella pneumoniae]|uniref:Uncharacterized protein n=1 Tax=Klebsiella pneumoniae TaxID=573 RepID=A0A939SUR2_KLEPN|nr:hypothetical protein [Klebsiella pneumoniae]
MVAYRETGHGEIDRQLASRARAARALCHAEFLHLSLLLTTLPLFATVRSGWQRQRSMCCARTLRR